MAELLHFAPSPPLAWPFGAPDASACPESEDANEEWTVDAPPRLMPA